MDGCLVVCAELERWDKHEICIFSSEHVWEIVFCIHAWREDSALMLSLLDHGKCVWELVFYDWERKAQLY